MDSPKYPKITEQGKTVEVCLLDSQIINEISEGLVQLCVFAKGKMDLNISYHAEMTSPSTRSLGLGDIKMLCQLCSEPLYRVREVFCYLFWLKRTKRLSSCIKGRPPR